MVSTPFAGRDILAELSAACKKHGLKFGTYYSIIDLIGDEQLPPENVYSPQRNILELPLWYVNGQPKPQGRRITFSTWKHWKKGEELLESGLIGPVSLRPALPIDKVR